MTDLLFSLLLLLGMAALVVADDRKLCRRLRYLATRWVSR